VLALKAAITTTPIVFTTASDPVQIGLVASMSRPGGNITGVTQLAVEVAPKLSYGGSVAILLYRQRYVLFGGVRTGF